MRTGAERTSAWVQGMVVGLALGLALTTAGAAQEQPAATPAAAAAQQPTAAKAEEQPTGGMGEGIKVHGHWTIDVRNPNGSLASHTEFENKLEPPARLVAGLLKHSFFSDHIWSVQVAGLGNDPCVQSNGQAGPCWIVESRSFFGGPNFSTNLTANLPVDSIGFPSGTLELAGSTTAMRPGSVAEVLSGAQVLSSNFQGPPVLRLYQFS